MRPAAYRPSSWSPGGERCIGLSSAMEELWQPGQDTSAVTSSAGPSGSQPSVVRLTAQLTGRPQKLTLSKPSRSCRPVLTVLTAQTDTHTITGRGIRHLRLRTWEQQRFLMGYEVPNLQARTQVQTLRHPLDLHNHTTDHNKRDMDHILTLNSGLCCWSMLHCIEYRNHTLLCRCSTYCSRCCQRCTPMQNSHVQQRMWRQQRQQQHGCLHLAC